MKTVEQNIVLVQKQRVGDAAKSTLQPKHNERRPSGIKASLTTETFIKDHLCADDEAICGSMQRPQTNDGTFLGGPASGLSGGNKTTIKVRT